MHPVRDKRQQTALMCACNDWHMSCIRLSLLMHLCLPLCLSHFAALLISEMLLTILPLAVSLSCLYVMSLTESS